MEEEREDEPKKTYIDSVLDWVDNEYQQVGLQARARRHEKKPSVIEMLMMAAPLGLLPRLGKGIFSLLRTQKMAPENVPPSKMEVLPPKKELTRVEEKSNLPANVEETPLSKVVEEVIGPQTRRGFLTRLGGQLLPKPPSIERLLEKGRPSPSNLPFLSLDDIERIITFARKEIGRLKAEDLIDDESTIPSVFREKFNEMDEFTSKFFPSHRSKSYEKSLKELSDPRNVDKYGQKVKEQYKQDLKDAKKLKLKYEKSIKNLETKYSKKDSVPSNYFLEDYNMDIYDYNASNSEIKSEILDAYKENIKDRIFDLKFDLEVTDERITNYSNILDPTKRMSALKYNLEKDIEIGEKALKRLKDKPFQSALLNKEDIEWREHFLRSLKRRLEGLEKK